MKNKVIVTQPGLVKFSWYLGLCVISLASLVSSCHCSGPSSTGSPPPDNTTSTPASIQFEKISFDREGSQMVVVIKNTSHTVAKNLMVQFTNTSHDNLVFLNNDQRTTTISIGELPASSSKTVHVTVDFQLATSSLIQIQIEAKIGQQVVATRSIKVNQHPIKLVPKSSTIAIAKQGETAAFKFQIATEGPVDFSAAYKLVIGEEAGKDVVVSIEGMGRILGASTNPPIITGADLEKLAQQKEILINITNNTTVLVDVRCTLLYNDNSEINTIKYQIVPTIEQALIPAATAGNLELVKQAINAFPNKEQRVQAINNPNSDGDIALRLAAYCGHKDVVELFINNGAEVNARNNWGDVALSSAANKGHQDIVELLINKGATVNSADNRGWTPLHAAANMGHKIIAELLISQGANVNAEDKGKQTPLKIAADNGDKDIVELFINKGAEVNVIDIQSWTPLHAAANHGYKDIVELLIKKGANVNAEDTDQRTPLHIAAKKGHQEVVQLLLQHGANKTIKDKKSKTAAEVAKTQEIKDLINKLELKK